MRSSQGVSYTQALYNFFARVDVTAPSSCFSL